jgi:formylmethanofuran dehydrogenase subunit E
MNKSKLIFSNFPVRHKDYANDIRLMMKQVIEKYGDEEWRLNVLTCEMHGHLGIYNIIGVKMGLYAREILNSGTDELIIVSFAGFRPPVSCLNDGLQVSTGSTLGHGLISIRETRTPGPHADFTCKGKTLRITLKEEMQRDFKDKIKMAIKLSGALTDEYWQRIRELGIDCWLELDRHEIFESQQISS